MDRGAWQATVYRVTKSRTRLSNFTFRKQWRTEEPGVLQFTGWQRVRHDSVPEQQQQGTSGKISVDSKLKKSDSKIF